MEKKFAYLWLLEDPNPMLSRGVWIRYHVVVMDKEDLAGSRKLAIEEFSGEYDTDHVSESYFDKIVTLKAMFPIQSVMDCINHGKELASCFGNDYGSMRGFELVPDLESVSINDFMDNACQFCINNRYLEDENVLEEKIEELGSSLVDRNMDEGPNEIYIKPYGFKWSEEQLKGLYDFIKLDKKNTIYYNDIFGNHNKTMDYNWGSITNGYIILAKLEDLAKNCNDIQDFVSSIEVN